MWRFLSLCAIFVAIAEGRQETVRLSSEKTPSDVRKAIFQNYDNKVIASTFPSVPVKVALHPIYIRELDEEKEILSLDGWLIMSWVDKRLSWNPSNFSGIKTLNVPSAELWRPDVTTYTASPDTKLMPTVHTNVIVNYTGDVLWVPPLTVSSRCPLQLRNFPHDVQQCNIKLGSWTMGSKSIDLQLYVDTVSLEDFQNNNVKWSLRDATVDRVEKFYPCCPDESYPSLNYNLTLQRRPVSSLCVANMVSVIATCIGILMFFLPSDSTQKFVLGALAEVLLGIVSMFLNAVIQSPTAKFYASERVYPYMIAVAVFLLFEVITVNVARMSGACRPPRCLLTASRLFCQPLESCAASKMYDELGDEKTKTTADAQQEWKCVATALDRILLLAALGVSVLLFKIA